MVPGVIDGWSERIDGENPQTGICKDHCPIPNATCDVDDATGPQLSQDISRETIARYVVISDVVKDIPHLTLT